MRIICFIYFLLFISIDFSAQAPLSPRIANYVIDMSLDEVTKQIQADQTVVWRNISNAPVSELQFHLYYNAFKSSESTFMKEGSLGGGLSGDAIEECNWGWIEVLSLKDSLGAELIGGAEYIQPDDDNEQDQTVLRVPLEVPVAPGATATFKMKWHSQIPKIMPRTGYNKDYHFAVQWFPKLGVYEPAGMRLAKGDQWNCHQYHASGEYYSDFGNYDVSIEVPKNYVVGASGKLAEKIPRGERFAWRYVVDDVIDFGWTASPHYVETIEQWKGVEIRLLTYPDHVYCSERYFSAVKSAMEYLDENLGLYPYSTLTVVDPPIHGLFTGGMEYPTFISSVSFCFLPEGIRTPETLVVHEFIHQYFMQMVATNELEEPWLDEGFTTYYEGKILDAYLGEEKSTIDFLGIQIGNETFNRIEFFNDDKKQAAPGNTESYKFSEGGYGTIAYNKTALWLNTLEGIVGEPTMKEVMRTYFERWKFKHPCGQDFIDVVNEVVIKNHPQEFGPNMDWFFAQVLYGTDLCDYSVEGVYNVVNKSQVGYLNNFEDCTTTQSDETMFTSKVVVKRNEGMILPVEIAIFFENGERVLKKWDGQNTVTSFKFNTEHKIIKAIVDPEGKLPIDKNWINNSYALDADQTGLRYYFSKMFLAAQRAIESLLVLI